MSKTNISITPDQITKNWQNGMTNNIGKMTAGVQRVTESPMAKAAANIDKMVAGVQAAAASGRTQAALLAVDVNTWKTTTVQKINERLSGGVSAAGPKFTKFASYLIPTVNAGLSSIANMPKLTIQDSINRATAWIKYMNENPYKK